MVSNKTCFEIIKLGLILSIGISPLWLFLLSVANYQFYYAGALDFENEINKLLW